ncbi:hypothetical protein [Streptomyces mirabilis]|uniref:hypothetical protein n=1 Tax=Streptomyces mirabilis TaxID=68239 RepID=UPI0036C51E48
MSELREQWRSNGSVLLPEDLVPAGEWEEIAAEAQASAQGAFDRVNEREGLHPRRDGSITSPQRCRAHPGGPALKSLATSVRVLELAREATGEGNLVPVRWGLKIYEPGDFMALHRDDVRCSVTFSTGVIGDLGVMGWVPSLRAADNTTVVEYAARHGLFPDEEKPLPIPYRQLQGFDGWAIPHHRPPYESNFGILGTFCYCAL